VFLNLEHREFENLLQALPVLPAEKRSLARELGGDKIAPSHRNIAFAKKRRPNAYQRISRNSGYGLLRRSHSAVDVFTGSAASSILHLRFAGPLRLFLTCYRTDAISPAASLILCEKETPNESKQIHEKDKRKKKNHEQETTHC
jgi:hypothetical protein